jgi:hypothetical protein
MAALIRISNEWTCSKGVSVEFGLVAVIVRVVQIRKERSDHGNNDSG